MKISKTILLIFAVISLFSCNKDDDNLPTEEKIETKNIAVNIVLPSGSNINPNDLKMSTILTDNATISNSESQVSTFDNEAIEMVYASNSQDNIVLIGYFDPKNINTFTINSETTAIALVMMHPWTSDLSVSAKKEAIDYIKNLPEFTSLKNSVEQSIISGSLDPLSSSTIIDKIISIQNNHFNKLDVYKTPLQFNVDESKIKIQNIQSSAAYSVGVYNSNNQLIEYKLVKGLGKTRSILNDLFTNTFLFTPYPATEFNTPTNNDTYYLKAKNGLLFDNSSENLQAAYENSKTLLADVMGIFSTTIQNILKNKLGNCSESIGSFVYNGQVGTLKISESLQAYSQGTKTGYLLTKDLISFVSKKYDSVVNIIKNCSGNIYNIKESPLKSIFKYLDIVTKVENAFNSGALVADWIQFDKTIETCFTKNGNDVNLCNSLIGKWKMTAFSVFGNDSFSSMQSCEKDDIEEYKINNVFTVDEGPTKCNPSDPQIVTDTYTYNTSNQTLTWGTSFDIYYVRVLNTTTLELENVLPNKGEIIIYTRQP